MAKELIYRDDVLAELMDVMPGDYESQTNMKVDIRMRVKRVSAVDAVEVVRCRECRYYKESTLFPGTIFCYVHKFAGNGWKINTMPDDYCSYGKRREDGDA